MTQTSNNARRFSPIFVADVTPASVSTRTGAKGKYTVMKGATVQKDGGEPMERTVMAFGAQRDEVAHLFRKGRTVSLAVQFDGGCVKVVGLPREKQAADA